MLDLVQVVDYFDQHFTRTAFRVEAIDVYDVETDGDDVARYLSGEPEPDPARKKAWLDQLRAENAAGKHRSRVHILRTPLNDYLRYECEWGYAYNVQAGEEIRILDLTEAALPDGLILEEFWLFDNERVLLMHYDEKGHFVGGEELPASRWPAYRRAADIAQEAAAPFAEWWARHPEEHRANRVA